MDAQKKSQRDRLIALGVVSLLLVVVYGPAASWFVSVDRFFYDRVAGYLAPKPAVDGVIVTIDPQGKSAAELAGDYGEVLARVRAHDARRIIMPRPPEFSADGTLPAWSAALDEGPPTYVPSRHPLAAVSSGSGYLDIRADSDGVLRRANLWYLNNGMMSPALPLAIALSSTDNLPAANVARNDSAMFVAGYTAMPRLTGDDLIAGRYSGAQLRGKTIFVDSDLPLAAAAARMPSGQYVTTSELVAAMLASIEAGTAITMPAWAGFMEILAPALLAVLAVLLLPGLQRSQIFLATFAVVGLLLVLEVVLLVMLHQRFDIGRLIVVVCGASLVTAILASASSAMSESGALKRGYAFLAAGRLEPAFAEFRRCGNSDSVADAMHKLSLAFEEQAQPQRAEAVRNWMSQDQQRSATVQPAARSSSGARSAPPAQQESRHGASSLMKTNGMPQQLGRYEIEKKLGQGAMGAVYLARDPRINRPVALKVIPIEKEFEDEELLEARERFFREAESAGRLAHPYIITVYDCGEDKHLAYIAMEYLQGTPLTYFKDPKKLLAPRKALELCARVAEGLDYAHNQGVIHRDIKPANLLYNAREDILKISDFGVARLTDNNRTKTGIVLGTPMYMAPEQLSAEELTGHSDLFSLGVTLYELLTGEVPFKATNIALLMKKITSEDPEPVSGKRPGLPPSVDAVLFKALAKRPEDRFANGTELAVALRNCAKYAST